MEIMNNSRLISILNKYSTEDLIGKQLLEIQEKSKNPNIFIPIIGVQGAGKSTLINSLIGKDLLPNEADETTCVPVEVRFSDCEKVTVHFQNGDSKHINPSKNALADYVDNNFNPGNSKNVSYIVIENNADLLKTGLVIVDLPGVGSLTHENEATTIEYIKKMSSVVFLISTVPQIRKFEAQFIKNVWRSAVSASFVQNIWTDNTDEEVNDALQYNRRILKTISEEIGVAYDERIIPVNAYNAASGRFNNDFSLIDSSNIQQLETELKLFAGNYKRINEESFRERVHIRLDYIENIIQERLAQTKMSQEQILDDLLEKRELLEEKKDEIRDIERDIDDTVQKSRNSIRRFAKDISEEKTNKLKTEMYHLVDKGLVDGDKLNDAFADYQKDHLSEVCDELFKKMSDISEELTEKYNKLQINLSFEDKVEYRTIDTNIEKKLKWEKGLKGSMILGADIGGVFAGGSIASAIGGGAAAGATTGTAAGPVGTVVGVVAGIAIALIGFGVASITKNKITQKRGSETKKQLEPLLDEYCNRIRKTVEEQSDQYFNSISNEVHNYIRGLNDQIRDIKDEISQIRRGERENKYSEDELQRDYDYLVMWRANNA